MEIHNPKILYRYGEQAGKPAGKSAPLRHFSAPQAASSALAPLPAAAPSPAQSVTRTIAAAAAQNQGTRLVRESYEDTPQGGYRRTQIYEKPDGRQFGKFEEVSFTENGMTKTIIRQNPSGSFARYEDILERQKSGSFQRTQRFTDESGDVAQNISENYTPADPFLLSFGTVRAHSPALAQHGFRGTQLDLMA